MKILKGSKNYVLPLLYFTSTPIVCFADETGCADEINPVYASENELKEINTSAFDGKKIRHISIENKAIFDLSNPEEDYLIYRVANKLQTQTRKYVIQNQLLFEEGDTFSASKIEESLRILRDREYILDASVTMDLTCDGTVDIIITAQDAWVIDPKLSYGREGGEDSSGIGFRNGNILGTGNEFAIAYEKNSERNRMEYRFSTSHLFQKNIELELYHADLSDGADEKVRLTRPFRSFDSNYYFNSEASRTTIEQRIRFNDEEINRYLHINELTSVSSGMKLHSNNERAYRLYAGVKEEKQTFSLTDLTQDLPEDITEEYLWIGFERVTNKYEQYTNLSYIARKQDIEVGTRFSMALGHGKLNRTSDLTKFSVSASTVLSYSGEHLLRFSSYADIDHIEETETHLKGAGGIRTSYFYFINGKNRWYFNMQYDAGKNLLQHEQFVAGESSGVRGYPLAYQRGNQRFVINTERRYYSEAHWFNLIRVGAVTFLDIGRAWGDKNFEDSRNLASVGAGLRFHSSKSGSPLVMHLNIAAPLIKDELDNYLISFSMQNSF